MANKVLWMSGSALTFTALLLSILVSISLPFIKGLDIVRIISETPAGQTVHVKMGIWATCLYIDIGATFCGPKGLGYEVGISTFTPIVETQAITATWTRSFIIHPIATAFIFIAFLTTLSIRSTINIVAFGATLFAVLMELIAIIINVAVFAHTQSVANNANINAVAVTSGGFWLSLVSLVLLIGASVAFYTGRRADSKSSEISSYPLQPKKWTYRFQMV
ncbi:hypothetical protein BDN70DRAFT_882166 [Pholiota conissans]|uniref:Pali-domain-containing protein n=1 Tax=Pholiota conissans TaxID=109636 RepID=A0A9P5YZ10_9AGAR|nr:hypothetical protein BDN70DRAFT_882166 [Pholiota conissans]